MSEKREKKKGCEIDKVRKRDRSGGACEEGRDCECWKLAKREEKRE